MNPFSQIVSEYVSTLPMLGYVAAAIGMTLGVIGLRQLALSKAANEPKVKGFWTFMAGSILVNIWVWMRSISLSFISTTGNPSMLSYMSAGSGTSSFIPFAIDTVQIIGVVGFIRGAIGLKDDRREGIGIPIGQMVFGSLAVNLPTVLHIFGNTVGGQLNTFIKTLIP